MLKIVEWEVALRGYIKVKQTKTKSVNLDPANFEMSKIYQGKCSILMPFGTVISWHLGSHFTEKKSEIVGEIFFQL